MVLDLSDIVDFLQPDFRKRKQNYLKKFVSFCVAILMIGVSIYLANMIFKGEASILYPKVNFTLSDDDGKTHKKIREKLDKIQENCTFIAFWLRIILSSTLQK